MGSEEGEETRVSTALVGTKVEVVGAGGRIGADTVAGRVGVVEFEGAAREAGEDATMPGGIAPAVVILVVKSGRTGDWLEAVVRVDVVPDGTAATGMPAVEVVAKVPLQGFGIGRNQLPYITYRSRRKAIDRIYQLQKSE